MCTVPLTSQSFNKASHWLLSWCLFVPRTFSRMDLFSLLLRCRRLLELMSSEMYHSILWSRSEQRKIVPCSYQHVRVESWEHTAWFPQFSQMGVTSWFFNAMQTSLADIGKIRRSYIRHSKFKDLLYQTINLPQKDQKIDQIIQQDHSTLLEKNFRIPSTHSTGGSLTVCLPLQILLPLQSDRLFSRP